MKKKLVLWGTNASDERILIAMQLHPETNKVSIHTFPENVATEEFSNRMMNEWRNDQEVPFPEEHQTQERELTVTDSILPDDIKVERGDIVQRAQTEWHFIVLSSKLYEAYESELSELKTKVEELKNFDSTTWDSLKQFWGKVQDQVRERNLFRDHANSLRENTNTLFAKLKEMRSALDEEFKALSQTHYASFMSSLEEVEQKVVKGLNLSGIFDDLKKLQREFRDTKFTKEHRTKIWERLDGAFKTVKEKRFGAQSGGSGDNSPMERLNRRYKGLLSAIEKMERSIKRDRDDLKFQDRRIADSEGQLEQQIRQAKIKMIEERISSKEEKLSDMNKTKADLERRIELQKERDNKQAERDKVNAAREAAKAKIAEDIKNQEVARSENSEELAKAASAIVGEEEAKSAETEAPKKETPKEETPKEEAKAATETPKEEAPKAEEATKEEEAKDEAPKEEENIVDAISTTIEETLEDVVDTVKAVAEVLTDKVEEAVAEFTKNKTKEEEE